MADPIRTEAKAGQKCDQCDKDVSGQRIMIHPADGVVCKGCQRQYKEHKNMRVSDNRCQCGHTYDVHGSASNQWKDEECDIEGCKCKQYKIETEHANSLLLPADVLRNQIMEGKRRYGTMTNEKSECLQCGQKFEYKKGMDAKLCSPKCEGDYNEGKPGKGKHSAKA
jgi:hypothetical protein